jgi:uncharacterized protein (TIGR02145 family)
MKKMFFLMLTFLIMGAASMNAQVTIGSDKVPHSGAVLDLQSDNLGLKLPNVELDDTDLTEFVLPLTAPSTKADAKGMYVYNTNTTLGEGVYVWDGYQWVLVKRSIGENPVMSLTIKSSNGYNNVLIDETINLTVIDQNGDIVSPVTWTLDRMDGDAALYSDGRLNGRVTGKVYAYAEAFGLHTYKFFYVVLERPEPEMTLIGTREYPTATVDGAKWMLTNSEEGVPSFPAAPESANLPSGGYYTWARATTSNIDQSPCPSGWHVPSLAEWVDFKTKMNQAEYYYLDAYFENRGGYYSNSGNWNSTTTLLLWSSSDEELGRAYVANYQRTGLNTAGYAKSRALPVRCKAN